MLRYPRLRAIGITTCTRPLTPTGQVCTSKWCTNSYCFPNHPMGSVGTCEFVFGANGAAVGLSLQLPLSTLSHYPHDQPPLSCGYGRLLALTVQRLFTSNLFQLTLVHWVSIFPTSLISTFDGCLRLPSLIAKVSTNSFNLLIQCIDYLVRATIWIFQIPDQLYAQVGLELLIPL